MKYDGNNEFELKRAEIYFEKLVRNKAIFEIRELKDKRSLTEEEQRTLQQNGTIHMWFAVVADFLGYTSKEECKKDVKRHILGQKEYYNRITQKVELTDYETHLMTIQELSSFMEKFKAWAQTDLGCYLPYFKDAGYEEMKQMYKNK